MISKVIGKFFDYSERVKKKLWPQIDVINSFYEEYQKLSDSELQKKTDEFKDRLKKDETLDDILPEAFAVVKETCRRFKGKQWSVRGIKVTWDMIPYDVQLYGAIILHQGNIAEMATGEGKTLVATMPIYLNALTGKGVHIATVNDYLASRDKEWMGPIFEFLGLTVGVIQNQMEPSHRKLQYGCDITYGTANEFGFDYLRDNMVMDQEHLVQRGHYYAIVDECDSILIDEARTPLIISGQVERSSQHYFELRPRVKALCDKQDGLIKQTISDVKRYWEAIELIESDNEDEAKKILTSLDYYLNDKKISVDDILNIVGTKLLQAQRGAPKEKQLIELFSNEPVMHKFLQKVESEYIRDKKLSEIDERLYYTIDEKTNIVDLTEMGRHELSPQDDQNYFVLHDLIDESYKIEKDVTLSPEEKEEKKNELNESFAERSQQLHSINQLIRAYTLFEKDVDYIVAEQRIKIIDEFTGRIMEGRRYSDGLHEALESKENVKIQKESQTVATITLQNYFRLYDKLAGMTGTAFTEAQEFNTVYKTDVVVIPPNKPTKRIDHDDIIYKTKEEKNNAIIDEIVKVREAGRPILVGTISVEVSDYISKKLLKEKKIKAEVLNAKRHQQEAEIVAKAGLPNSITISTNMAGRGTDIKLPPEVVERGGLHIIGTEKHESRRVDRQLRGRSGRQGDSGSSRFYLSLEDNLMRLFGSDRISGVMEKMGMPDNEPIQHSMITKSIERAQKRVEMRNFDIRKHLLEFDDIMDKQRKYIYELRTKALTSDNLEETVHEMIDDYIEVKIEQYTSEKNDSEDWELDRLKVDFQHVISVELPFNNERYQDYFDLKPEVEALYDKQDQYIEQIISDVKSYLKAVEFLNNNEKDAAKQILSALDDYSVEKTGISVDEINRIVGFKMLRVKRGAPNEKQLNELFSTNLKLQKLVQKLESDYKRDNRFAEIDEQLYYRIDKETNVDLTEMGRKELSPEDEPDYFVLSDLPEGLEKIKNDETLSPEEIEDEKNKLNSDFARRSQKLDVIKKLIKSYALYNKGDAYIVENQQIRVIDATSREVIQGKRFGDGLHEAIEAKENIQIQTNSQADLKTLLKEKAVAAYERRKNFFKHFNEDILELAKTAILHVIDSTWKDHLYAIDQLKEGINLRAYGQKDPLLEFKTESYNMFLELLDLINDQVLTLIFNQPVRAKIPGKKGKKVQQILEIHEDTSGLGYSGTNGNIASQGNGPRPQKVQTIVKDKDKKRGRNEPCWCNSGKKYKKCHGANQ